MNLFRPLGALLLGCWLIATLPGVTARAGGLTIVPVSDFSGSGLDDWQSERFEGETTYRIRSDASGAWLEARAQGTASGLYRELSPDLDATPVLAWSWWVDGPVPVDDVRQRSGDDFAARVYVVFSGGLAFWRTTTLVYVWGTADAPTRPWPNPFTDHAMMIAATRGPAQTDWTSVRRNVVADYRRAFGHEPGPVSAVAIMTDTDQTGTTAVARYRNLRFEAAGGAEDVD